MARFTWENFDTNFLENVIVSPKTDKRYRPTIREKDFLAGNIKRLCAYPDQSFVLNYREEIELLLRHYPDIVKKIGEMLRINNGNFMGIIAKLSSMPSSSSLVSAYIEALWNISGIETDYSPASIFAHPISLDMKKIVADEIPLYDFQDEAVAKLYKHFIKDNRDAGMLVMPTGSGKTRTATYFLIRHMISQGYQVIWLTHRHMLIDQTAGCFYDFAKLAKIENPEIAKYKMMCASEHHRTLRAAEKKCDVMILSIQSTCRSLDYLRPLLGHKVIIVVDEAHHTLARSYQNTIRRIRKYRKDVKLLGLTATPIRITESGSRQLMALFDNQYIYKVSMSDLIAKNILSDPHFERINTEQDFEPMINIDEEKFIQKYGELPESLVTKIANSKQRNQLIVDTYLKNREAYGKTLIFALNKLHCLGLAENLSKHGIKCDYIYSGLPDIDSKIKRFCLKKNDKDCLDVLININIMTEGSDVPDIETIFLTRPTSSEGLLMQMIGRGMRGKDVGGTPTVNIVDFYDKWDTFAKWLNPEFLISEENAHGEVPPQCEPKLENISTFKKIAYPTEFYRVISEAIIPSKFQGIMTTALPICWYALIDDDGNDCRLLIFEDQLKGYKNLIKDKKILKNAANLDYKYLRSKYFGGFCMAPSESDLELFLNNLLKEEFAPQCFHLSGRRNIDPIFLAERILKERKNPIEFASEVYDANPMAQNIYRDKQKYQMLVCQHLIYNNGSTPIGLPIEELPIELIPFRIEPVYNIDELLKEVKDEMFGGIYENISYVTWTDKLYKSYYGMFYFKDNHIMINSLLNSPDVPREAVKYVIYHELLHRDYPHHDIAFRTMEHKYPNYTEWELFLNSQMTKFDIKEW